MVRTGPAFEPTGVPLRVLCYNVHGQRDDVTALGEVVRAAAADVVIVQEAPRRFGWRYGCAALARRFGLLVAAGGLPGLGNLLLTNHRVRVERTWYVRYPLTPGRHLRGAALASCRVGPAVATGGRGATGAARFVLAGAHLATDPVERPNQARLLKAELDAAALPVICGADVNETAEGSAWRTLAAGLTDPAEVTGNAGRGTFPARDPRRRIDVVLVDSRIGVLGYRVLDDPACRVASDHLPILVDLLLPVTG